MVKVLLVVSDRIEMTLMRFALESNGCEVEVATNGFSALKKLDAESAQGRKEMKYDLLVTSEKLPVMTGADLCREVKKIKKNIKVIGMDVDSENEMPLEIAKQSQGLSLPRDCFTVSGTLSRGFLEKKSHGAGNLSDFSGPREEAEYDYFIGGAFKIQKVAAALDFVLGTVDARRIPVPEWVRGSDGGK